MKDKKAFLRGLGRVFSRSRGAAKLKTLEATPKVGLTGGFHDRAKKVLAGDKGAVEHLAAERAAAKAGEKGAAARVEAVTSRLRKETTGKDGGVGIVTDKPRSVGKSKLKSGVGRKGSVSRKEMAAYSQRGGGGTQVFDGPSKVRDLQGSRASEEAARKLAKRGKSRAAIDEGLKGAEKLAPKSDTSLLAKVKGVGTDLKKRLRAAKDSPLGQAMKTPVAVGAGIGAAGGAATAGQDESVLGAAVRGAAGGGLIGAGYGAAKHKGLVAKAKGLFSPAKEVTKAAAFNLNRSAIMLKLAARRALGEN